MKKKSCKHEWELSYTKWEWVGGCSGTGYSVEYAYLFCKKCLEVIKREVTKLVDD